MFHEAKTVLFHGSQCRNEMGNEIGTKSERNGPRNDTGTKYPIELRSMRGPIRSGSVSFRHSFRQAGGRGQ